VCANNERRERERERERGIRFGERESAVMLWVRGGNKNSRVPPPLPMM